MNQPTERMLARLQAAVEAQRKADEMLDDLADEITRNSLNDEQREDLEEYVKDVATSLTAGTFKPVQVEMAHLENLLHVLEFSQP